MKLSYSSDLLYYYGIEFIAASNAPLDIILKLYPLIKLKSNEINLRK